MQTDELPDIFMASLPGVRAKQFAGDPATRQTSNRVDLPQAWKGTTGGSPGKSLEIFVLAGDLQVGDIKLRYGGYAHVPPGSFGFNLQTENGARILYFLDDVDPLALIRAPIILDTNLIEWQSTDTDGVTVKDLRSDPGNGARTWLMKVTPDARLPWQSSSVTREGYLADGQFQDSECVAGEAVTEIYRPGGYFYRSPHAFHGGPDARALTESIWVLRERTAGSERTADACQ